VAAGVPITAISATTRIDCKRLYEIIMPVPASADVAELLTPVVRAFEAGQFKFRRSGRYSDDPNRWNIIETCAGGACWGEDCILGRSRGSPSMLIRGWLPFWVDGRRRQPWANRRHRVHILTSRGRGGAVDVIVLPSR
jgi:hypothetical protein